MPLVGEEAAVPRNWAGTYEYAAPIRTPASIDEVRRAVAAGGRVRALGTRHSFTDLPDTYLLAQCGDIDITGHRTPASLYREIAFGLRSEPAIAVHRPPHHGRPAVKTPWSWDDAVSSWSWGVAAGAPVTVDAYARADADEVELLLDGRTLGVAPVGSPRPLIARFETMCAPGELVAIARRGGAEVGRTALRTAGEAALRAAAETDAVDAASGLAYVAITLADPDGIVACDRDVEVTVAVEGPGELARPRIGGGADPRIVRGAVASHVRRAPARDRAVDRAGDDRGHGDRGGPRPRAGRGGLGLRRAARSRGGKRGHVSPPRGA